MVLASRKWQLGEPAQWFAKAGSSAVPAAFPAFAERRTVLWAPVALAAGILFYFSLKVEPPVVLAILAAGVAGFLLWRADARPAWVLLAVALAGFALAKGRAEWVATPLLTAPTGEVLVVGLVENVTRRSSSRDEILLQPEQIEFMPADQLPRRLRLSSFRKFGTVHAGDRVSLKARLAPLPGPVMPGGFDYGRQLYFSSIGGTGRITSGLQVIGQRGSPVLWVTEWVNALRETINSRILAALPGEEGSLAAALITGERAVVPKQTLDSLQVSGLFHILSISGLHMSLAAGGMFWFVRAVLALSPTLALQWPIKKMAAVAALAGGFIYMLLAGSGAATQRSYIMVAIMLFAVLVDRPAISLRNLAIAALIILVLQPESAIEASFQMSFMAVMGLAAFFEWWNGRMRPWQGQQQGFVQRAARWFAFALAASLLTSVVAGSLSSIPAAYHFGRLAPYGVLANGLAIPIVSLLVMPAALLALLVMPFGLEQWPLQAMGLGLQQVIAISDWVATLPGARRLVPQVGASAALVMVAGAVVLCLAQGKARLLGLAALVAGLILATQRSFPDILIERTAANAAVKTPDGSLAFARPRKASFAAGRWLQANGEDVSLAKAVQRQAWRCQDELCLTEVRNYRIAYVMSEAAPMPDCAATDLVISAVPLRGRCKQAKHRIDRFDVWRYGATAVQIRADGLSIATAAQLSGRRPWVVTPTARRK